MSASVMPPGPAGNYFLGTTPEFSKDPVSYLNKYCPQYDKLFTMTKRFRPLVIIHDPEYVKYVLQDNNKNYFKSVGYEMLRPLLGNGLLTSEGKFWMKQRRLIQPSFHKKVISSFYSAIQEEGEASIRRIHEYAVKGEVLNVTEEMTRLTMAIVSRCMFSTSIGDEMGTIGRSLEVANRDANFRITHPFALPRYIPTSNNRKVNNALDALNKTVTGIIEARRSATEVKHDLLSMLLESRYEGTNEGMDDKQLRDEIATIFVAGLETTANALCWTLYALDCSPDVQQKMQEEIHSTSATAHGPDSWAYTKLVVKESLRLFPPAWVVGRRAVEDDEIGGYRIPKNTNVLMPTIYLHRNPDFWPDPLAFKPERHTEDRVKELPKYAYFPFGGGPRLCVGVNFALMELQLLLPMLLREFRFKRIANQHLGLETLITLHPKGGLKMQVESIKKLDTVV